MKCLMFGVVIAGLSMVTLAAPVRAGWNPRKTVEKLVNRVTKIDASIEFRNSSRSDIVVVMDSNRETHTIAAGGKSVFHKANVGDAPTFSVRKPDGKTELFARKIGVIGVKSSLGWNGGSF